MSEIQLTTVDRILAGISRDLRGTDINESDIIEWVGEAMDFLSMPELQTQSVAFLKVENYEADVPDFFKMVLQIAKYNKDENDIRCSIEKIEEEPEIDVSSPDCCDPGLFNVMLSELYPKHKPYFSFPWEYINWVSSRRFQDEFTPIRLANNTFFNSIVCQEIDIYHKPCGTEEYTIVGTVVKKLRFSFKDGYVALSYIGSAVDEDTGYPLIPDNIRHISAIKYYIKWNLS